MSNFKLIYNNLIHFCKLFKRSNCDICVYSNREYNFDYVSNDNLVGMFLVNINQALTANKPFCVVDSWIGSSELNHLVPSKYIFDLDKTVQNIIVSNMSLSDSFKIIDREDFEQNENFVCRLIKAEYRSKTKNIDVTNVVQEKFMHSQEIAAKDPYENLDFYLPR